MRQAGLDSLEDSRMPLSHEAQALIAAFGQQPGVTRDHLRNLQQTVEASPALIQEVNHAVEEGHLRKIVPLNNPHAGGEYEAHYSAGRIGQPAAHMEINLRRLHLDPQVMADNGIDLGASMQRMPYLDTSTHPPTQRHFEHTASSPQQRPLDPSPGLVRVDDIAHPDHELYKQARTAVQAMDSGRGRPSDHYSDNLAASLVVAARRDGLRAIHHAVLAEDASRVYAVEGELQSPVKRVAQVDTAQAVNTPISHSSQVLSILPATESLPGATPAPSQEHGRAPAAP